MPSGVELATAWIRIVPSMEGINGKVTEALGPTENEAGEAGDRAGKKFSTGMKLAITAMSGVVVGATVKMFSDSISAASDLNEAGTAVQAIFGDATSGINKWAESAATNLGQSQLEALNAAKSFGVFGTAAGLTNEENAKFSTGLAGLASDFASFHNVTPQEAIEAIGSGLRGEAEPLRRFGVLLDDASLKAKAMEMGLYDGNGALTQQQKIMAAQALITEQAGAATGDFARTSDGLANQQRIMDATLTNLSATVGQAFLPALQGILAIAQPVIQFFSDNPNLIIAVAIALGVLAAAIVVANIVMWALAANPIVLLIMAIVIAVGVLIAAIVWLVLEWDMVSKFIGEVWNNLMSWLKTVIDGFVSWWNQVWTGFASWIKGVWDGFVGFIRGVWDGFIGWIMGVLNGFVGWWNGIWEGVGNTIETVFGAIGDFIGGIWDGIISGIKGAVNSIIRIVNGLIDGINGLIGVAGAALGLELKIPRIPLLAKGGTVTGSGSVIVGEKGPELLTLPKGAQVNPDFDTFPAKGVTFNNYAPLGSTPAQALTEFADRADGLF